MKACYIHVPFCKHICAYCDFVRCGYQEQLADKWLKKICNDIREQMPQHLETIYIGGGTPTALSNKQLEILLTEIKPFTKEVIEYTIEANPDSLTTKKIKILKTAGVNRISLGVQTFQPPLLTIIERNHSYEEINEVIKNLQQLGIFNISIDLMYGLPSQTMELWKQDLFQAITLPIQHISLYSLTIEENSQFGRMGIKKMEPQLETDMYEYAISFLNSHGFIQYEISNFAKVGKESKHNLTYWQYEDFLGIGCGASGKEQHERYDNTKNLHIYITKGANPQRILLDQEDEMFEMIMMSLRMKKGLNLAEFKKRYLVNFEEHYAIPLQKHLQNGNLKITKEYLYPSYRGMLLLNDVLVDFLIEK